MVEFDKKQVLQDIGRVKYMQQSGMDMPPAYTRRMLKRLKELNMTVDDVKPIKVDLSHLKPKPKKKKDTGGKNFRRYKYYKNGKHRITGTKKEIAEHEGITVHVISQLVSKGGERRIGQGIKKGGDTHMCIRVTEEKGK